MDDNIKKYKYFFILNTIPSNGWEFNIKNIESKEFINEEGNKIYISNAFIDKNVLELKLLWETTKQIKSEELNDYGEIDGSTKIVKEVNQAFIWLNEKSDLSSPLVFIFTRQNSLVRDVQKILKKYLKLETLGITFTNRFFDKLLKTSIVNNVQSSSFQSINGDNYSLTISGEGIDLFKYFRNFEKQDYIMTNITISFLNNNKVKIYRNGKILIYNTENIYDVFDTIHYIGRLLLEESDSLE